LEVPAGAAFPVCHVLSVWGRWSGRPLARVRSSQPRSVDGAACVIGGQLEILVANATAEARHVELDAPSLQTPASLPAARPGTIRRLDASAVAADPDAIFAGFSDPEETKAGQVAFELSAYGLALIEFPAT
jgi:hypothetical protein